MGKTSKTQQAEQLRQHREELRRKQEEMAKKQKKMTLQIVIVVAVVLLAIVAAVLATTLKKDDNTTPETPTFNAPAMESLDFSEVSFDDCTNTEEETNYVRLNISYTDKNGIQQTGDVIIRLYENVAPETVKNFKNLVKTDYYDGSIFHRIYKGFMIQGGTSDSGTKVEAIKGEFTSNGHTNNLKHLRGVISMARTSEPDSATSQFFIMHKDTASLDRNYASFGYVVYGMDTVDGIAETEVKANAMMNGEMSAPIHEVVINYATFVKVD